MARESRNHLIVVAAVVLVGAAVALAGSQGSVRVGGVPVFALAICVAYAIQWLVFIPSAIAPTEKFFDLTGSLTFIVVMTLAVVLSGRTDARTLLLLVLVGVWAARLGSFLFLRIRRAGADSRFDEIKKSRTRFLVTWTIQGLWVSLTLAAALGAVTSLDRRPLDAFAFGGLALWIAGFTLEVAADVQKSHFRADASNRGRFIRTGLWAWSRHPNYLGEILLWIGVAAVALPLLHGWQLVTLISPVFVLLLLTRVSGVPLLEKKADATWGGQPGYEEYKRDTPVLLPRPPRARD